MKIKIALLSMALVLTACGEFKAQHDIKAAPAEENGTKTLLCESGIRSYDMTLKPTDILRVQASAVSPYNWVSQQGFSAAIANTNPHAYGAASTYTFEIPFNSISSQSLVFKSVGIAGAINDVCTVNVTLLHAMGACLSGQPCN